MKKIFLCCLSILYVCCVYGQSSIYGTVSDESNVPVAYSTVQLLDNDSAMIVGVHADSVGNFKLTDITAGQYMLRVTSLGYKEKNMVVTVGENATIAQNVSLSRDNYQLDEVLVTGTSYIRKKDHIIAIPSKEQKRHAFTGYDLLYNLMIPGLTIDRREAKVTTSRGEATLYINGVEADIREVTNLRPRDIERVEYYDIPSGRYVGDAASINYITKKPTSGGYVNADAEQTIGYQNGKYNLAAKVNNGSTNYTFFGGAGMQEHDGSVTTKEETFTFPDQEIGRTSNSTDGTYKNSWQYAQFKVSDNKDKRDISALVSLVHNKTPHNDHNDRMLYDAGAADNVYSKTQISQESLRPQVQLKGYFRPAKNQEIIVVVDGAYTKNSYNRLYSENGMQSGTDVDEKLYSFSVRSTYEMQLKHDNTFSAQLMHFHNVTSSIYSDDYDLWQHLWCGETIAYIQYMQQFKNGWVINIYPGVSWLNYKVHGDEHKEYWTFRTNTWAAYRFNDKHMLGAGVGTGNTQASLSYLNNSDQNVDFILTKKGNPNLDNTKYLDCFLTYEGQMKYFVLQLNSIYSIISHNITPIYFVENDRIINSYQSASDLHRFSNTLDISSSFSNKIKLQAKLGYQYVDVKKVVNMSQHTFTASLDANFFVKDFSFNIFGKTPRQEIDESTLAYLRVPGSYGMIVRYNKGNFMAEVGTDSPFTRHNRYHSSADYSVYRFSNVTTSRVNQQTAWVKLAYTLDFGKKTQKDWNDVNRTINSAILKAE